MKKKQAENNAKLTCSKCKASKPATEFPGHDKGRPGYYCSECLSLQKARENYRLQIERDGIEKSRDKALRKEKLVEVFFDVISEAEDLAAGRLRTEPS